MLPVGELSGGRASNEMNASPAVSHDYLKPPNLLGVRARRRLPLRRHLGDQRRSRWRWRRSRDCFPRLLACLSVDVAFPGKDSLEGVSVCPSRIQREGFFLSRNSGNVGPNRRELARVPLLAPPDDEEEAKTDLFFRHETPPCETF